MAYLSNYTATQRWRITLLGLVFLGLVAYGLSIRQTVALRASIKQQETQLALLENAPQQIAALQQRLQETRQQLGQMDYDRNAIFSAVSAFCERGGLQLQEFGLEQRHREGEVTFITNPITVSGAYHDMLRLIYFLEQEQQLGYVIHTDIQRKRQPRSRREELSALIHLQHVVFNSN